MDERPKLVSLPDPVVVRDLATALGVRPYEVLGSLLKLNVLTSVRGHVDFATAAKVCLGFGVTATKRA